MCLYPKLIRNPKYKENKKNGGRVPAVNDTRVLLVPIGCQECIECRKQKGNNWKIRLIEDIKTNTNGKYITLTFSNESIKELAKERQKLKGYALDNAIATLAVRRFTERWRKEFKKTIRHWLVTELGHNGTENIHMHGILWTDEPYSKIREKWGYGFIYPRNEYEERKNYVSERSINYMIKYVTKVDLQHKFYKSIILTSNGIGANYIPYETYTIEWCEQWTNRDKNGKWTVKNYTKSKTIKTDKKNITNAVTNRFQGEKTDEGYRTTKGHKLGLPTYYRNKLYTDEEREELWIHKLNKEKRYVLGREIDISKGEEQYYKALKTAKAKNKQLGFGEGKNQWIREQYENERRQIMINKRIEGK